MIGIINCDLDENPKTNGANLIQNILKDSVLINIISGEEINLNYDGYVITGSRASFNDDEIWIKKLKESLIQMNKKKIPCLGICFGMQIIADTFGGTVKNKAVEEEGFYTLNVKDSRIFENQQLRIYQSHYDAVLEAPKEASVICKNSCCIQGFEFQNFTCVQFHPEINLQVANEMARRDGKEEITEEIERNRIIEQFEKSIKN